VSARAVVFAYGDMGIRCLSTVLDGGIDVPLVVTHADDPHEARWFGSVADFARGRAIAVVTPENPNTADLARQIAVLTPAFLFSFYYRQMLGRELLCLASRGALNMHGSLLPKYRGRAPLNWAILSGEAETGVTLHYMEERPDAGPIVDSEAVPILPDETAIDVFRKMTEAAVLVLRRSLPGLTEGTAPARPQDLTARSYFGRRSPEDGIIDWSQTARRIHDLVRAVAPPYPGAWTAFDSHLLKITRTRIDAGEARGVPSGHLCARGGRLFVGAGDHQFVEITALEVDGASTDPEAFARRFAGPRGGRPLALHRPSRLSRLSCTLP